MIEEESFKHKSDVNMNYVYCMCLFIWSNVHYIHACTITSVHTYMQHKNDET